MALLLLLAVPGLSLSLLLALMESTSSPHLRKKKFMLDKHTLNFKNWNSHSRSECFIHTEPPYFFRNSRTCEVLLTDMYISRHTHTHTQSSVTQRCSAAGGPQSSPSFRPRVANQTISNSHRDPATNCPHAAQLTFWCQRRRGAPLGATPSFSGDLTTQR